MLGICWLFFFMVTYPLSGHSQTTGKGEQPAVPEACEHVYEHLHEQPWRKADWIREAAQCVCVNSRPHIFSGNDSSTPERN